MTAQERAQVVELLRCSFGTPFIINEAAVNLGCSGAVLNAALKAFFVVLDELRTNKAWPGGDEGYDLACLEAAQRVEDKEL